MLLIRTSVLLLVILLAACTAQDGPLPLLGEESASQVEPAADAPVNEEAMGGLPSDFDVQGHRGARGLKPENTLPAFETALDLAVTTLELDLHYTADQIVVIWHDDKIDKDKCGVDPESDIEVRDPDSLIDWGSELMISQLKLEQLQAYRCDRNPDPGRFPAQESGRTALAGDDYRVVSLAELFDFVDSYSESERKNAQQRENAGTILYNIETKRRPDSPKGIGDGFDGVNPGPFELEILRLVEAYGLQNRITIQSFDHRSLWAIRAANPDISLAALTSGGIPNLSGFAEQGVNIWSPNQQDVSTAMVIKSHEAGLRVIPWTVNETDEMRALIAMGVDGIISDRPDVLLALDLGEE